MWPSDKKSLETPGLEDGMGQHFCSPPGANKKPPGPSMLNHNLFFDPARGP